MELQRPDLNVLLVEFERDNSLLQTINSCLASAHQLSSMRVNLTQAFGLDEGINILLHETFHILLLSGWKFDHDILEALERLVNYAPNVPLVTVLGSSYPLGKVISEKGHIYLNKTEITPDFFLYTAHRIVEQKQNQVKAQQMIKKKQALCDLGQFAIGETSITKVLNKALALVAFVLDMDFVSVFEASEDRKQFRCKAGIGWNEGLIGILVFDINMNSLPGQALLASRPIIRDDLTSHEPTIATQLKTDKRFCEPQAFYDHEIQSGICNLIYGKNLARPYGVLGAFSKKPRDFNNDEAIYLRSVANIIAASTYRYQIEKELEKKIQELDSTHQKKDDFLAALSHELRTPLTAIIGFTQLLLESNEVSPSTKETLEIIYRNAELEGQLVSDTLEMSRIITGKLRLTFAEFSFEKMMNSAIESIQLLANKKSIKIITHFEQNLDKIVGDCERLHQVAWNLLSNAVKFTPESGQIHVIARRIGESLELIVSDSGQGIAKENLNRVFDRFWQEESALTRTHNGLGLGLSIVHQIVELHGGMIKVASPGRGLGATFTVTLPTTLSPSPTFNNSTGNKNIRKSVDLKSNLEKSKLSGLKVIVIDDSTDSLFLISKLLRNDGAQVKTFSSPYEGLHEAMSGDYQMMVCDIGMPYLDGYELIKQLREWEKSNKRAQLPAIALTAYASESDIDRSLASGYSRHVSKPITLTVLQSVINELI